MLLNEKYLAQFERNSGLKKGTVSKKNHLFETYMSDARANDSNYQFFVVMDLNGESKIIGGNDYKEDAIDAAKEYLESGIRLKVYSLKYLQGKGLNPEDDANWGNQEHINAAMQMAADGGQQQMQQEALAGVPSQQDADMFQASEYESNDEPENDKDAESQDAMHLGEDEEIEAQKGEGANQEVDNSNIPAVNMPSYDELVSTIQRSVPSLSQYRATQASGAGNNGIILIKFSKPIPKPQGSTNSGVGEFVVDATVTILRGQGATEQTGPLVKFVVYKAFNGQATGNDVTSVPNEHKYNQLSHLSDISNQVMSAIQRVHQASNNQQQNPLAEIDNMMAGNDAPSNPDMASSGGGGVEWMDGANDNQMNSLGDDEGALGEGIKAPDLNGTRAASAREQDNAAFYRNQSQNKGNTPVNTKQSMNAAKMSLGSSADNRANKYSYKPTHLPEQSLSLNESSKALYAKSKVNESEYERFLRNAGIKK